MDYTWGRMMALNHSTRGSMNGTESISLIEKKKTPHMKLD
jgi:hypothetical protein